MGNSKMFKCHNHLKVLENSKYTHTHTHKSAS